MRTRRHARRLQRGIVNAACRWGSSPRVTVPASARIDVEAGNRATNRRGGLSGDVGGGGGALVVPEEDRESSRDLRRVIEGRGFTDTCNDYARGRTALAEVVRVYNKLADHEVGPQTYSVMLGLLSSLKKHRMVAQLAREMAARGVERSLSVYAVLIENLADRPTPRWGDLALLLREIAQSPLFNTRHEPITFRATLRVCCKWRHQRAASEVLLLMQDIGYHVTPGALAACVATFTCTERALHFACGLPTPVAFDVTVFNALLSIAARQGDVRTAWRAYRTLLAHDIAPTLRTYNALLNAHKAALDMRGFLHVLSLMQGGACDGDILSDAGDGSMSVLGRGWRRGLEPDELTLNTLLSLCSRLVERDARDGGATGDGCRAADGGVDPYALAQGVFQEAAASGRAGSPRMVTLMLRMHRAKGNAAGLDATLRTAREHGIPLNAVKIQPQRSVGAILEHRSASIIPHAPGGPHGLFANLLAARV